MEKQKTAGNTDGTNQGKQDKRSRKTQIIQTKKAREYKHKQKTQQDFKNEAVNAEWRLEGVLQLQGWNHTPYFPWECGLERRACLLVECWIQEDQCGVCGFHGTLNQLFILSRTIEGGWEFAQLAYMRFVDLEK